ncbi:MAG TPA: HAMP domain-containing sensor histidine kinase [Polyangia bacterium]|nr:HAMP domain-containing sensor histidine kinase [Polyangia bacterium]
MGIAIAILVGLAYWDAARASRAALDDLADEQATLARGLAAALAVRSDGTEKNAVDQVLQELTSVERQGALRLYLMSPASARLEASDGRAVSSDLVVAAARRGDHIVRLPRTEAKDLDLPARAAFVGLAPVERGPLAGWTVAVAATALRERDRDRWAQARSILSVVTAAGLLLTFAMAALRNQRKELDLERELAVAATRAEQNERLASATRAAALGTLAIGVAHEVSTPLGVIAGRAEQLLAKVGDDQRGRVAVQAILDQTDRISQVVRGLLGLARGDRVSADHLSAARVAEGARALVEHRFSTAGVQLTVEIPDKVPTITGDARLIESALVNLLLNACDACASGGLVRLSVEAQDTAVRFSVIDDGAGISPRHVEKVLEPFFTTKANGEGTGLGLAIANEIVKSHLGTLTLTPSFPRGTSAIVELPADYRSADA